MAKEIRQHWQTHGPFTNRLGVFRIVLLSTSIKLPRGQASHMLRQTFASHFIMNGRHIVTLQHILGHASLSMTMRYAHLSHRDHLAEAVLPGGCRQNKTVRPISLDSLEAMPRTGRLPSIVAAGLAPDNLAVRTRAR
ncbi:bacteriophage integrase [Pseudomonas sp. ATCC 13867]|nr:bacteriophage integrase [Pseudomonas sp. ATCC 13867]